MAGSGDFQRDVFDMLWDSQWWSAERLLAYQRNQLGQLLRYAKANVPFYDGRLDAVVGRGGEIDWDRWHEIPIVSRRDMIDHRDAMHSRAPLPQHGATAVLETSGSTSLPIKITSTWLSTITSNASRWRGHRWSGLDWSRHLAVRLGNTTAPLEAPFGEKLGESWAPPWTGHRGEVWALNVHLPATQVLDFLTDHDCGYLNTGAAPAHVFALEAERLQLRAPHLDAVLAQGASVGAADRAACARVFGARMIEIYSSREGGQMAHPCEHGRLHISAEACLVEVVDADGLPVGPGKAGRVLVTPFFSTAQPLIRYEQGDIARLGGPCPCGRALPTIDAIEGRSSIFFTHPDGRRATSLLPDRGRTVLDCTFWQIAQVGPLDFEVRYVPNDWSRRGDEDEFIAIFRAQYFDDARVTLRRIAEIPLTPSGKFVEYKLEMPVAPTSP